METANNGLTWDKTMAVEKKNNSVSKTDDSFPGKEKCRKLREIRKLIAEVNGIPFEPAVCHHNGPCFGTCRVCDAEIVYLDSKLEEKKLNGEKVILSGLAVEKNISSRFNERVKPEFNFVSTEMGEPAKGDIFIDEVFDRHKDIGREDKNDSRQILAGLPMMPEDGFNENEY